MSEITLHFHGKVEIITTPELLRGFVVDLIPENRQESAELLWATKKDIDTILRNHAETYVIYADPGNSVRVARLGEALEQEKLGCLNMVRPIPGNDLLIACSSELSIDCDGELYIFGPLVVFRSYGKEICDVGVDDVYLAGKILDEAMIEVTDATGQQTMAFIFAGDEHERI